MRTILAKATALLRSGDHEEAVRLFRQVLLIDPNNIAALGNLGAFRLQSGAIDESIDFFVRSLRINPSQPLILNNLAIAFRKAGRFEDAIDRCDRALKLKPDYAECWNTRGNIMRDLKLSDNALTSYSRALALRPDYPEAHHNIANVYHDLGLLNESLASYNRALALKPNYAEAYYGRGNPLRDLGRFDEALADYEHALELAPDDPEACFNKAILMLLRGDYAHGWKLFEARWRRDEARTHARDFAMPLWLGNEDLSGRTLFLHAEQGFGDTLQFCRYALKAKASGAIVTIEVQSPLIQLVQTLDNEIMVTPWGMPTPIADFHCPLMSLPFAFGTTLETIPSPGPYLSIRDEWRRPWVARLSGSNRPRIGLAWSGNPYHRNDRNRSIPLDAMRTLLDADAEFHCLQKGLSEKDRSLLLQLPQLHLWENELADFSDTATLASMMDLVVCVDTSVAHLAGTLGIPCWVLLPHVPDYRWLLDREDTPWYQNTRLFRQTQRGDWPSVIDRVANSLQEFLKTARHNNTKTA